MNENDLISITEGALMYGRSRMSFVWLVESGRIPHMIVGCRKFVCKEDVKQLIKNRDAKEHRNSYIQPVRRSA